MKYLTDSENQTIQLGKKIATKLKGGEVIGLVGNLGAGKTTLIKGIAKGLGIKKPITSPTFVLMKVYPTKGKIKKLIHIDCYRVKSAKEIEAIGATEYFGQKDTVIVIEWAEKIKSILSRQKIEINIKLIDKDEREIIIKKYG
ncbi:MAG: tRNA (adenosine(37)-N6)-threonylcarbamoyltransferase complex ATPase subunit type 1 TsaE [Candidatus Buchananbacteria bacterium RIFCSPHIGHO2_02_FULL_38_8]|uniref:tRNA threonylcarbamoyladenosine biosynthesis protein TsaE n=1 Tax=Candidatus Buchananbacteria bacterium RIFCSPHIGHO2_02_FULL_38_8 TaxID=1797538 RepID=A0A1G1Y5S9_9BACT|nr:MAG: tRNA (adenosine(37)-N6)-threonylcarbamoyltransferase complex ATPase subunit type 1 TsaE [Candidatus Buchananbacteria bacterium RIFCSPHIGHO2_02_FULL_38_8]